MAPEIMVDGAIANVGSHDLKNIDIWALGMIIFCVLNPDISFPYKNDLKAARAANPFGHVDSINHIKSLLEHQTKPTASLKYCSHQQSNWYHLVKIYESCTSFQPSEGQLLTRLLRGNFCKDWVKFRNCGPSSRNRPSSFFVQR